MDKKQKKTGKHRVTLRLANDLHDKLKRLADANGSNLNEEVNRALRDWIVDKLEIHRHACD